ncbi:uncharacterized protein BKCO1_16000103 [Diplodia corticola]|uniref:Uncharacterized protein n=1 Tax=Diplodia corticola TaxID=236234 RepID=A0A1J9RT09_9PEZI|nr:uncharacterized protein BKCO1_16000103 [Diplodia corticola]OJD35683.1 hypothetical protein BKCO1_16000103 [Diplodia corticola]
MALQQSPSTTHQETSAKGGPGKKKKTIVIRHKGWSSVLQRWQNLPRTWKNTVPLGKRRETKGRHRSPNEHLTSVLREHGKGWGGLARVRPGKANLSYVDHDSPHDWEHPNHYHPYELFRPSLQFYLARYLQRVYRAEAPDWNCPLAPHLQQWLARQGYTENDFRVWGKILTADKAHIATSMLLRGEVDGMAISRPTPIWVLTLLCRRHDVSARAVRGLLKYVGNLGVVGSQQTGETSDNGDDAVVTEEKTFTLICIRLLRKARLTHPASIEDIANLLVTRINSLYAGTIGRESPHSGKKKQARWEIRQQEKSRERRVRHTLLYNQILALLSLPTSLRPVVSAALQQRAQFIILRAMSEYEPPLTITQKGYRAVARVQLAQLKTKDERKWAELKSTSWPPWKEDRTAMDSDIGPEQGLSRAGQTILRMNEAGYPSFGWDRIVQLYGGWDSDGSPVIQHRKVLGHVQDALASALTEGEMSRDFPCSRDVDHEVWAARVRTTRTVEQSWAIFLAYDALEVQVPQKRILVYAAMFERIVGAQKLSSRGRRMRAALRPGYVDKKEEVPGDQREALPTPDSPHERLDPRLKPPSVNELFESMISNDIYPDNDCLSLLLRTSRRIDRGLDFIRFSRDQHVRALLELYMTDEQVEAVPEVVFDAYIDLLCRFCWVVDCYHFVGDVPKGDGRAMLHRAVTLMDRKKSRYLPGWNRVLAAVHRFDTRHNGTTELTRQTLKVMENAGAELDTHGFQTVCFSFAYRALIRMSQVFAPDKEEFLEEGWAYHVHHNDNDSRFLRTLFSKVVGLSNVSPLKQQLATVSGREPAATRTVLSVPPAVTLHQYIRALGILGDYEGILSTASFMHDNVDGLLHHCDNELNGHVRLRRTIVALRCFLERSWDDEAERSSWSATRTEEEEQHAPDALFAPDQPADQGVRPRAESAPEELIMLVRDKVEDLADLWGHWPSDEELEEYVNWHHLPRVHRSANS